QRDISALASPIPMITGVEEIGPLERWCSYTDSGIMGTLSVIVCLAVPEHSVFLGRRSSGCCIFTW
ncbi:hypothetical protein ILYODFUR_024762, partial [Ilyodon furcidens]